MKYYWLCILNQMRLWISWVYVSIMSYFLFSELILMCHWRMERSQILRGKLCCFVTNTDLDNPVGPQVVLIKGKQVYKQSSHIKSFKVKKLTPWYGFSWYGLSDSAHCQDIFMLPKGGSMYSWRFVCPSGNLVRQTTLKLLLAFKWNLVYR